MKNLKEVQDKMNQNLEHASKNGFNINTKEGKKIARENKLLRSVLLFLEKNPNEDFLKSEKSRLQKIISEKEKGYEYWSANICDKSVEVHKRKSMFNKELGLTKMRAQIKHINFILA